MGGGGRSSKNRCVFCGGCGGDDISVPEEEREQVASSCVQTVDGVKFQVRRWLSWRWASGRTAAAEGRRRGSTTTSSRCRGACCAPCAPGTAPPAPPTPPPPPPPHHHPRTLVRNLPLHPFQRRRRLTPPLNLSSFVFS